MASKRSLLEGMVCASFEYPGESGDDKTQEEWFDPPSVDSWNKNQKDKSWRLDMDDDASVYDNWVILDVPDDQEELS